MDRRWPARRVGGRDRPSGDRAARPDTEARAVDHGPGNAQRPEAVGLAPVSADGVPVVAVLILLEGSVPAGRGLVVHEDIVAPRGGLLVAGLVRVGDDDVRLERVEEYEPAVGREPQGYPAEGVERRREAGRRSGLAVVNVDPATRAVERRVRLEPDPPAVAGEDGVEAAGQALAAAAGHADAGR